MAREMAMADEEDDMSIIVPVQSSGLIFLLLMTPPTRKTVEVAVEVEPDAVEVEVEPDAVEVAVVVVETSMERKIREEPDVTAEVVAVKL
ncbi:hypothetical protein K1719_031280 [Acacia pycnantha]|nr:hypothetical protein K1719_034937 [Acacia pycnantha]KAI9086686.1 hypothetical protein K1719_031280 [Acacia pycnantha]